MTTPFSDILRIACQQVPGAIGGAFAAYDGITVDHWTEIDEYQWEALTAHYGVILSNVQAALRTRHFGEAISIAVSHEALDIFIHSVKEGYYALLAVKKPSSTSVSSHRLSLAARALREEMG